MKTNFSTLVGLPTLFIAFSLVGCGGGGTTPGVSVAKEVAAAYDVKLVNAPTGVTLMEFDAISSDSKQIAGDVADGPNIRVARYKDGIVTVLTPSDTWSRPNGINSKGDMAATISLTDTQYGFSIISDTLKYFPLGVHEANGWGSSIDESGTMYRTVKLDDDTYRSYAEKGSSTTPITVNGEVNTSVRAVSPHGLILAYSKSKFYVFNPSTSNWTEVLAGESDISPSAISDNGTISGNQKVGGKIVGFVCKDGFVENMADSTSSYASMTAANAGGIAVGSDNIQDGASKTYHAFAWSEASGYVDLNSRISEPNFVFHRASGISDNGTIVGYGYKSGTMVGVILTPKK